MVLLILEESPYWTKLIRIFLHYNSKKSNKVKVICYHCWCHALFEPVSYVMWVRWKETIIVEKCALSLILLQQWRRGKHNMKALLYYKTIRTFYLNLKVRRAKDINFYKVNPEIINRIESHIQEFIKNISGLIRWMFVMT